VSRSAASSAKIGIRLPGPPGRETPHASVRAGGRPGPTVDMGFAQGVGVQLLLELGLGHGADHLIEHLATLDEQGWSGSTGYRSGAASAGCSSTFTFARVTAPYALTHQLLERRGDGPAGGDTTRPRSRPS